MFNLQPMSADNEFHFTCDHCGQCCRGHDQTVPLEPIDVFHLSRYKKQSGNDVWTAVDILNRYATPALLSESGYPMFFINTRGPDGICIFHEEGKCLIHDAKPRTCRMYPMTVDPDAGGKGYMYYLMPERKHHFTGTAHRAGDWIKNSLTPEDYEYSQAAVEALTRIAPLMERNYAVGIVSEVHTSLLAYYLYQNYDIDKPFVPQFKQNAADVLLALDYLYNKKMTKG